VRPPLRLYGASFAGDPPDNVFGTHFSTREERQTGLADPVRLSRPRLMGRARARRCPVQFERMTETEVMDPPLRRVLRSAQLFFPGGLVEGSKS